MKSSSKPINIAEFKAHLGRYLRLVRSGKKVVVADRGTPVAVLVPYSEHKPFRLEIHKASKPWSEVASMSFSAPELGAIDPLDALLEERGERLS